MEDALNHIKMLIHEGKADEAIRALDALIEARPDASDEPYYLRGNAYRKTGNWQQALNNYLCAIDLNPDSHAVQAREILMDILNFYNKDMYNQ